MQAAALPKDPRAGWPMLGVGLSLAVATALSAWLDGEISLTSQAMIYLIVVVIAAYAFDRLAAVVSAVGAVTAFNFFFVPPRFTLAVEHREHLIALAAMLLVGLLVSYLSSRVKRESAAARESENRARQLRLLATELADAGTETEALRIGRDALAASFAGPIMLVPAIDGVWVAPPDLAEPVAAALRHCMVEGAALGPGTGRWPGLGAWYLPLGVKGRAIGAARIEPAEAADDIGREHAHALCALVAQSVARLRLAESNLTARADLQREQLQSTFLAAVSHDLRTPLAAIVTAASALEQQRDRLPDVEQDRMLRSIVAEAGYLTTITENTLQLVRLSSAPGVIRRDWESMEEIVGAVLGRLRARDPSSRLRASVEPGLPLVRGDATLLAQLLSNLLDNALRYADGPVVLSVSAEADQLHVSVKDRGPGIGLEDEAQLFEPFFRGRSEGAERGAGLGLALCKAIADAHIGTLALRRREGGGSCFTLSLPVDRRQPTEAPE